MKKKLEAELISIAHRILKLKNRAELDQLQQETLKLYEKISVLKFVEDNFSDVKPTIGYSSAEKTLEDIYGIEETEPVHANEIEGEEDKAREEKNAKRDSKPAKGKQDKENDSGEGITAGKDEAPVAEEEKKETEEAGEETAKPEGDANPEQEVEEYEASEEEKEETEESGEEVPAAEAGNGEEKEGDEIKEEEAGEEIPVKEPEAKTSKDEAPEAKVEVQKPEGEIKAMEEAAEAVFNKEQESSDEEEDKAIDAEVVTIAPDKAAKVEDSGLHFDFAFERKPAPEEPKKQKEISFEDFQDYKEPEFVRKGDTPAVPAEEPKFVRKEAEAPETDADDWQNWEPSKSSAADKPKEEPKAETRKEETKPEVKKSLNDAMGKTISLGLNDRIAFEKHLFGGSSEDLNRVLSQLNTMDSFEEARNFVEDLVKPDYNNWQGKEQYEERFMSLVEKKFD